MPVMGEARIDAETGVVQHFLGWAGAHVHRNLCTWPQQNAALGYAVSSTHVHPAETRDTETRVSERLG